MLDAGITYPSFPDDQASDDALVTAVLAGDEQAMSILYRRYVGAIYRYVMAQVRVDVDAEDLTAETFARMLRGLPRFRGEASFKNWLYQIARNAVRNHRRAAHYRLGEPLSPHLQDQESKPATSDSATRAAERKAVLELLAPLPPRYRRVLELRFLQGLSVAEAASQLGVTEGNCKVLQHRALKKAAQYAAAPKEATHAAR